MDLASRRAVRLGRAGVWWGCLGPVPVTRYRAPPSLVEPSQGGFEAISRLVVARHPHHAPARPSRTALTHRQRIRRRESVSKSSLSVNVMTRIMTSAQTKTICVARISRL
jgi:hypothetical protein